jgi:hypothetical protein
MPYQPKPHAHARRVELAALFEAGLAALHKGKAPTVAQAAALRNAYRTACRAVRDGRRATATARQLGIKQRVEQARAVCAALQSAPVINPFTGQPL